MSEKKLIKAGSQVSFSPFHAVFLPFAVRTQFNVQGVRKAAIPNRPKTTSRLPSLVPLCLQVEIVFLISVLAQTLRCPPCGWGFFF